jgi:hypothetical protein
MRSHLTAVTPSQISPASQELGLHNQNCAKPEFGLSRYAPSLSSCTVIDQGYTDRIIHDEFTQVHLKNILPPSSRQHTAYGIVQRIGIHLIWGGDGLLALTLSNATYTVFVWMTSSATPNPFFNEPSKIPLSMSLDFTRSASPYFCTRNISTRWNRSMKSICKFLHENHFWRFTKNMLLGTRTNHLSRGSPLWKTKTGSKSKC